MNALKKTTSESYDSYDPDKIKNSRFRIKTGHLGRDIAPVVCDASLLIKINISNTYQRVLDYLPSQQVELSLLKFSINGDEFYSIDGNNRDAMVANALKAYADSEEMKVSITAGNVIVVHTVERQLKNNFLRCVNEGMLNFYTMAESEDVIEPVTGKTFKELYGDRLKKLNPTCCQFTRFLKYGYTHDSEYSESMFVLEKVDKIERLSLFSLIQIRHMGRFVHEFLHISNGVCLEKMGGSIIAFAKAEHILECYEKCLRSKNLKLFELIKRPEFVSSSLENETEQPASQCFFCEIL